MNIKIHTRRIISMLLVLCMFIGLLPVHAMAAPTVSVDETAANVAKVLNYADQMRKANVKSNYSTGGLTWDPEKKSDSWRYFLSFETSPKYFATASASRTPNSFNFSVD